MSFTKTISVVAALGSIFSVGLASWKISEDIKNSQTAPLEQKIEDIKNSQTAPLEQKIEDLEKKLEEAKQPIQQPVVQQTPIPQPQVLPPLPPVPEPKPGEFE